MVIVRSLPHNMAMGSIKYTAHKIISQVRIIPDNGMARKFVMMNRFGNW